MESFKSDVSSVSSSSQRKDEGLTLEMSALENPSTQLRKPPYCVIPPTDTATQFLYKLTPLVQYDIGHIKGCERELLCCMLYILLETKNLISLIHFPFLWDDHFSFVRKLNFFFQQKEERNQLWFEAIFLTDSEYNEDSALLFIF